MSTETAVTPQIKANWAGVIALGLGIFSIVMAEFLPASLLPRIAQDLGVTAGAAGQSVTVTAAAAAATALLISVVLPRADRRRIMLGLTLLAVASNILVALAPNLTVLLAARALLGVALGGFWSMAIAVAAHLVPASRLGRALTVVNAGVCTATVAAVPLGAWLGELWGWRAVFGLGAAAAALALVLQAVSLPAIAAPGEGSGLRALGATLRSGIVLLGLLAALLIAGGHFAGYTYIRPVAENLSDIDASGIALMLLVFGIGNFVGTVAAGPIVDQALRLGVLLFPAVLGVGMLVLLGTGGSVAGLFIAAALWGFGFGGVPTSLQTWGARTEPTRLEQIGGLLVVMFNVAIAVGAVVGGILVDAGSPAALLPVGGLATIAGGLLVFSLRRR
ncbi:Purine ribonucleoside efflux pump NepI [Arthrobacter saudimassiliensis]|uniref:Purine ribonucleoside efflux pump NepI n=1 Tax=Arthrobacter saudimassiliensis TaxID=1461584 RepID=A0A078MNE4_9MICC|nr:Purine ribonucleoside efflux pump NepI [Arthrobacter saudimassiliensis]